MSQNVSWKKWFRAAFMLMVVLTMADSAVADMVYVSFAGSVNFIAGADLRVTFAEGQVLSGNLLLDTSTPFIISSPGHKEVEFFNAITHLSYQIGGYGATGSVGGSYVFVNDGDYPFIDSFIVGVQEPGGPFINEHHPTSFGFSLLDLTSTAFQKDDPTWTETQWTLLFEDASRVEGIITAVTIEDAPTTVPEPSSWILVVGGGLMGLAFARRKLDV